MITVGEFTFAGDTVRASLLKPLNVSAASHNSARSIVSATDRHTDCRVAVAVAVTVTTTVKVTVTVAPLAVANGIGCAGECLLVVLATDTSPLRELAGR